MEYVTAYIHPLKWTEGNIFGMSFELEGENPSIRIDWGDGKSNSFTGKSISAMHKYPKDDKQSFMVMATATSGIIVHAQPSGGDCYYESADLSHAPSLRSAYIESFKEVKLNNPLIERLTMRILLGSEYDLSSCVNLRELIFDCESDFRRLDLSMCHKLERLECWGFLSDKFTQIAVPNDAPLKYVDIKGHHFTPQCLNALRRIVQLNGGIMLEDMEDSSE